ncbi:SH3 domain-containing protein, partial [Geminicoccus flavidas]|uniref:SH3 domain-containing protein n=1 Tax=Geminicoccus flavidas TaxID=2506407 RepID=UPI001F43E39E
PPEPVAAAAAGSPAAQPAADQAMGERFRVVAAVSVRAGPGTRFERQGAFSGGEIVVADQQEQGWYRVSQNDEPQGWVFRRWLTPVN